MSSSDSDDCYGNIAQKLQSMKSTYKEDDVKSTNLLDITGNSVQTKQAKNSPVESFIEANVSINSTDNDDLTLDAIIANNSTKRATRRSKRNANDSSEQAESPKKKTRGRGRGRGRGRKSAIPAPEPTIVPVPSPRGRGRGTTSNRSRSRTSNHTRQATHHFVNMNPALPIYSVGNTDEYPDECDNQQLFTTTSEVVVVEENDPLDDNEELSVKVYWQSSELFKFTIRRYQKFTQIFDHFAKKEDISPDKLLFTYNERILKIDDTPDSIDYSIVKFIDGGIVNQSISKIVTKDKSIRDGVKIKFQCQNAKKPYETVIKLDDKLQVAMTKCAEHLEKPLSRLKFKFDGDTLQGRNTARELDFEGGECIDVEIMS